MNICYALFFSDLHEVASFVAVRVLGGEGERRAGEVQLAFASLSSLRVSMLSEMHICDMNLLRIRTT